MKFLHYFGQLLARLSTQDRGGEVRSVVARNVVLYHDFRHQRCVLFTVLFVLLSDKMQAESWVMFFFDRASKLCTPCLMAPLGALLICGHIHWVVATSC